MVNTKQVIKVFVASPSDTENERGIVREVIQQLNPIFDSRSLAFEFVGWEFVSPGIGSYPQDVINTEIDKNYDVFVGIIANKFGTETPAAGSGTEEEFNIAYQRYKDNPDEVELIFYFSDAPVRPSEINITELAKIEDFKNRIRSECGMLTGSFATDKQFEDQIRLDLSKIANKYLEAKSFETSTARSNPTSNLQNAECEKDELGYYEAVETTHSSLDHLKDLTGNINTHTSKLSAHIASLSQDADLLSGSSGKKKVVKKFANILRNFTDRMAVDIREYDAELSLAAYSGENEHPYRFESEHPKPTH